MGTYIHNLATTLIGRLGITPKSLEDEFDRYGAQTLYEKHSFEIKFELNRMKPETLGKIAACGLGDAEAGKATSLYKVHCGSYLGKYENGRELLREIACTAIVAEMRDILAARRDNTRMDQIFPNFDEEMQNLRGRRA